ncbi:ABC transporter G family member 20-like protein [Leptotrombidium deliense]|uniref:ABC transporter G family member 20-like protein n=1 Tax=Leptotrombidium deliense TaxID=299467 RepID=A0A443SNH6_9ACAR|nr:ABC transporter G family member 20-like protein [Leptotrombidium deliense]
MTSITFQRSPLIEVNFNAHKWFSILFTVLWKITIQSVRQRGMLLLQLILPILTLTCFCFCVGRVPFDVPLAVVNEESPPDLSAIYLRNIDSHILKIQNYSDLQSARDAVLKSKAWAVLHIRANFSDSLIQRFDNIDETDDELIKAGQMTIHADLTNDVLSITLKRALDEAFKGFAVEVLELLEYNPKLLELPIQAYPIHGSLKKSNFFELQSFVIPGLLVILTYTFGFSGTMLLTMSEKNDKIYDRNVVGGVTSTHIVVGHLISRFMFMSFTSILLVFIALVFFNTPAKGSVFWAIILLFLQTIAGLTNGMMISSLCANIHMAVIVSNGVLLFIFIISGVLWSVESLPYWLRWFSYITPTTLPTQSLRSILARGLGISDLIVFEGFFVSIAYAIFFASISVFFFPH